MSPTSGPDPERDTPRLRAAAPTVSPGRPALRPGTPGADAGRHRDAALPPPHRTLGGWIRHPGVRLAAPYLVMVTLMSAAVVTGGLLPALHRTAASAPLPPDPTPSLSGGLPVPTAGAGTPTAGQLTGGAPGGGAPGTGRPADALRGWAAGLTARVKVPPTALEAYGYAELAVARDRPACHLSWTTLAAIGQVESRHGSHQATLDRNGKALPTIYGAPLDGTKGNARIPDTDRGVIDGDRVWDRAVGPMQFIPGTWRKHGVDADGDGATDPSDIDDAAVSAGQYLCANGRDLGDITQWWQAILSYNNVGRYAQDVYRHANDYGVLSRS
ncbi:murein transglycosylase [Pilimelia terevasa]|uniref:Murein transglycosylase n=1 Tax=Pilimelia terevasa TaxID=53372 RepID=A0A8J3FIL4_9ACTN|nr:lytic murein transglycosylase [Pilimelia terevasa]GGK30155.1 murein transglycosylase [Pilimelia terevasa]